MRNLPRAFLVGILLVAVVALHPALRTMTVAMLRFPWIVLQRTAATLIALPQLPSLRRELGALRVELSRRQLENSQLREQVRHAEAMRTLRHAELSSNASAGLIAAVIARSLLLTQHTVLLDRGRRDGVGMESIVLDAFGVVGRVVEPYASSALVLLLTDPESRVAALIERSRESGMLFGRGGSQCELRYLDLNADLREGDRVVTAGLGGTFPKGLLLGVITRIARNPSVGLTSAWVAPAARLGRLEDVLCIPAASPPVLETTTGREHGRKNAIDPASSP